VRNYTLSTRARLLNFSYDNKSPCLANNQKNMLGLNPLNGGKNA
jgi:hypothetical protein